MFVLRKTMEAAVEAQRRIGASAVAQLAERYGESLSRVTALQQQLMAWLIKEPGNITPEQMAQMFYAQDDRWQAAFFNCLPTQITAWHEAQPKDARFGYAGVPAGEPQWWHVAQHLDDDGFATLEAMFDHAKSTRERRAA